MTKQTIQADVCIIGAGSGGLSVAAGAAQLGRRTVLIEKHRMGGDCLNTGCVPSKALLAAGRTAQTFRTAGQFGISPVEPVVDFAKVHDHVHGVIAAIEPNDSVERFTGFGCTVIQSAARLAGPQTVETDDGHRIEARHIVIATGSRASVPPIPGLDSVPFLTNETVFEQTILPKRLIVIGGGPIGLEMAQAHRRLGAQVTVLERDRITPKDDPELVAILRAALTAEGINIREGVAVNAVERKGDGVVIRIKEGDVAKELEGDAILIAAGRRPNVEGLNLEAAGVHYDARGIKVDARLRTSNRRIFAIGDVSGGPQFTHVAGYQAGVVIQNMLFWPFTRKVNYDALPWVTYTDPELAQVGLTESEARRLYKDIRTVRWPFHENDRAQAERAIEGLVKVVLRSNGKILGASMVGHHAGELLQPWILAISAGLKLKAFTGIMAPYPTMGEVNKRAAGAWFTPTLFSDRTRAVIRFLARFH